MPQLKLTEKTIAKLPAPDPSGKQVLHWDTELKGFGLKVTPAGSKVYILQDRKADHPATRCQMVADSSCANHIRENSRFSSNLFGVVLVVAFPGPKRSRVGDPKTSRPWSSRCRQSLARVFRKAR